jgi:hypothetical protein
MLVRAVFTGCGYPTTFNVTKRVYVISGNPSPTPGTYIVVKAKDGMLAYLVPTGASAKEAEGILIDLGYTFVAEVLLK